MNGATLLLVEDEQSIADIQSAYFRHHGYQVHHLTQGDLVLPFVRNTPPDLIVLDVMLPGLDGVSVCRQLREFSAVPIIMVTARVAELDRLLGFETGADDYLCKPFSPRELVARVQAVLRRTGALATSATLATPAVPAGPQLQFDEASQRVSCNGVPLDLSTQQFRLLQVLAGSPGRIFSRTQLLDLTQRGDSDIFDRAIDSQIKHLRKRLAQELPEQQLIHSVYGVGYRYEVST